MELDLISSITSTNIQKIRFAVSPVQDRPGWTQLDDSLCRLVDRLECGLRLEMSFRDAAMQKWWTGEQVLEKHLPRFYEKGGISGG